MQSQSSIQVLTLRGTEILSCVPRQRGLCLPSWGPIWSSSASVQWAGD